VLERNGRRVPGFDVGAPASRGCAHGLAESPEHPAPWKAAIVTTVVAAATGWALEEIARRTFKRRRR